MSNRERLIELKERLKAVPLLPGVYLYKNLNGDVIYVGKARVLRNRLRSYFQDPERLDPKVRAMMMKVQDFDYIVTASEVEALVLECNMIKSYKPRYNIFFRDDKSYPYLKVTLHETYPRIMITREKGRDASRYFGPYTDAGAVKETVRILTAVFPLRTCKEFKIGRRPCLNRDIERCLAPCTGEVAPETYQVMIRQVISFLEGDTDELLERLQREMEKAAADLDFELAAQLRDSITGIRRMNEQQKVAMEKSFSADMIALAGSGRERLALLFTLRNGKLIGKESFQMHLSLGQTEEEALSFLIQQFYSAAGDIPSEILVDREPADRALLESWLTAQRAAGESAGTGRAASAAVIRVPARGEKKKLLDMAAENAQLLWEERLRKDDAVREILKELGGMLHLPVLPERIECFDISHLGGEETVASMVVFTGGEKDSKAYRRFKIQSVSNNDVESMREAINRRLAAALREDAAFLPLPDLLMVDGGLAQANAAAAAVSALHLDIPIISLAKRNEEIFRPGVGQPLRLPRSSEVLKLLQRMRDEAHRFAIEHNRKRIKNRSLVSILDHIAGIGEKRRNVLIKKFGSLEGIKKASVEELAAVGGMNRQAAEAVYQFFHGQEP